MGRDYVWRQSVGMTSDTSAVARTCGSRCRITRLTPCPQCPLQWCTARAAARTSLALPRKQPHRNGASLQQRRRRSSGGEVDERFACCQCQQGSRGRLKSQPALPPLKRSFSSGQRSSFPPSEIASLRSRGTRCARASGALLLAYLARQAPVPFNDWASRWRQRGRL